MKTLTPRSLKISTFIGLFSLSISLLIFVLWQRAFNLGHNQTDRVAIFRSYFPDFLNGRGTTTYLSIAFLITAIILSSISLKLPGKLWKVLNYIIIVFSIFLLLLNLFTMM